MPRTPTTRNRRARRHRAAATVVALFLVAPLALGTAAGAQSADPAAEQAAREIQAARDRANAAAQGLASAEAQIGLINAQIADVDLSISRTEVRAPVAGIVEERGRLVAALTDMPVDVWPSGANFVLFRPREVDGGDVWKALVERSVLVRNCASWPRLEGCLRVTIGTPGEDDRFLDALGEVLR